MTARIHACTSTAIGTSTAIVQPNERTLITKINTTAMAMPTGIAIRPAANPIKPVWVNTRWDI